MTKGPGTLWSDYPPSAQSLKQRGSPTESEETIVSSKATRRTKDHPSVHTGLCHSSPTQLVRKGATLVWFHFFVFSSFRRKMVGGPTTPHHATLETKGVPAEPSPFYPVLPAFLLLACPC